MANLTLSLLMVSPSNHEGSDDGPALSVLFTRARPPTHNATGRRPVDRLLTPATQAGA